jgi:hypothetical protein
MHEQPGGGLGPASAAHMLAVLLQGSTPKVVELDGLYS